MSFHVLKIAGIMPFLASLSGTALTLDMHAGMSAFFFGNMAQNSLTQTGAFEVFFNGALVS